MFPIGHLVDGFRERDRATRLFPRRSRDCGSILESHSLALPLPSCWLNPTSVFLQVHNLDQFAAQVLPATMELLRSTGSQCGCAGEFQREGATHGQFTAPYGRRLGQEEHSLIF